MVCFLIRFHDCTQVVWSQCSFCKCTLPLNPDHSTKTWLHWTFHQRFFHGPANDKGYFAVPAETFKTLFLRKANKAPNFKHWNLRIRMNKRGRQHSPRAQEGLQAKWNTTLLPCLNGISLWACLSHLDAPYQGV
jgi:hypothetical protein